MPPPLGVNLKISSLSRPSSSEFFQLFVLPLCFSSSYRLVLLPGTRHFIPMSLQATWEHSVQLSSCLAPCIMWSRLGQTLPLFRLLTPPSSLWVSLDWVHGCLAGATVPNSFAARHGPAELLQRVESKSQAVIHFPFLITSSVSFLCFPFPMSLGTGVAEKQEKKDGRNLGPWQNSPVPGQLLCERQIQFYFS